VNFARPRAAVFGAFSVDFGRHMSDEERES
jgi:hypothetical protein